MTATLYPDVRPLIQPFEALVLEALDPDHPGHTPTHGRIREALGSTLHLVWACPAIPVRQPGSDGEALIEALSRQADRYQAERMNISATDCWWLAGELRAGLLRLVTADTLAAGRSMSAATTARARALELLQAIDPHGAYTDHASQLEDRNPTTLAEAIRSAAALIEDEFPVGSLPAQGLEVLRLLAQWAWEAQA